MGDAERGQCEQSDSGNPASYINSAAAHDRGSQNPSGQPTQSPQDVLAHGHKLNATGMKENVLSASSLILSTLE